jgi:ABC-2 type transport system permease protein
MSVLVIAGRELRAIFNTTIGWLVLAGFLLLTGIFWASMLSYYTLEVTNSVSNPYASYQMNFNDYLFAPFFGNTAVVLMMVCPALSMRLFSEELKQRTLELLLTSPVSTLEIVLGKFLGALGFVAIMLFGTAIGPLMLNLWASPDLGVLLGGYLGLLLVAGAILSMGALFSAMTDNQIVALVLTFASAMGLWVISWVSQDQDSIFVQLALVTHVQDFMSGLVYISHLVYFIAFIGFFLFATWQRVESYRWS